MPIYRSCTCGTIHPQGQTCPERERVRNAQPNRKAHRTQWHQTIRKSVLERDNRVCHECGGPATECDYLVPLSHGGRMHPDNAKAACKSCNSRRGATVRQYHPPPIEIKPPPGFAW